MGIVLSSSVMECIKELMQTHHPLLRPTRSHDNDIPYLGHGPFRDRFGRQLSFGRLKDDKLLTLIATFKIMHAIKGFVCFQQRRHRHECGGVFGNPIQRKDKAVGDMCCFD